MTTSRVHVHRLRCEYRVDPEGIDPSQPRLSWEIRSEQRDVVQAAYQIVVTDADGESAWDSGRVDGGRTNQVPYGGRPLESFEALTWRVRVWIAHDEAPCEWSEPARWSMGILAPSLWNAQWVGYHNTLVNDPPYLRRSFEIAGLVRRAMLYATARGVYEPYLNGERVGDECFAPGWTDYAKRLYYRAYDVTDRLVAGPNALGAILGDGWYRGRIGFTGQSALYGGTILLLMHLRIELADGTVQTVVSDESWKAALGPILQSGFLPGESYDARQSLGNWSAGDYDDARWLPAQAHDFDASPWDNSVFAPRRLTAHLQAHPAEPVRRFAELTPVDSWETMPGSTVFDLGQNFAGWVRLRVQARPGTVVRLRFGEVLSDDRSVYVENLRSADSTDTYVVGSADEEVWEPRFTVHGFQYVEVTGLADPGPETVTGIAVSTDLRQTGQFQCGHDEVNQLFRNTLWTQRANFIETPTDCPQRDERLGWTGDALAFVEAAAHNADVAAFLSKWLTDLRDTQWEDGSVANIAPDPLRRLGRADAAWADALTGCPMALHEAYGDTQVLAANYPAMTRLVEYYQATSEGLLRGQTYCYGDWLNDNAPTPNEVVQTAYFIYSLDKTAQAAAILGRPDEAKAYQKRAKAVRDAFRQAFVSDDGDVRGRTQTAYLLALSMDLLPEELRPRTLERLVADIRARGNRLSTGFIGTHLLLPTLSRFGRHDVAYDLLLQTEYPSWLFPVRQGATSIWERWDGWTPDDGPGDSGMNSYAHYAFGAVVEWLYRTAAGIDRASPGYRTVRIAPAVDERLGWVRCSYHSIAGPIECHWRLADGTLTMNVSIPANTTADVRVPTTDPAGVTKDDEPAADGRRDDGGLTVAIGSGSYRFEAPFRRS